MFPSYWAEKAIHFPSGENAGLDSRPTSEVRRRIPPPFQSHVQRSPAYYAGGLWLFRHHGGRERMSGEPPIKPTAVIVWESLGRIATAITTIGLLIMLGR